MSDTLTTESSLPDQAPTRPLFGPLFAPLLQVLFHFLFTLTVYLLSPNHQMSDSQYSMLLSQSLVEHQSFRLDDFIPQQEPQWRDDYCWNGSMYQIELVEFSRYYHFPPGSSILSVPYVAVMSLFGIAPANPNRTYNRNGEMMIQASLAALLMAALSGVLYLTARLLLPLRWSVIIALGAAFGTQMYSSASRGMWSDTWGILLLGIVVWLLLHGELGGKRQHPVLLATLLAWMYFVRPTYAVDILCISAYIGLFHRKSLFPLVLTGLLWLALFVGWSWLHFHSLLPSYYHPGRLTYSAFWTAVAGNLISPARGLLVYCPVLLFVAFLLLRYCRHLAHRRLLLLVLAVIVAQLVMLGGFEHWWGGHSYGPRLTTGLMPWLVVLAILALRAMLDAAPPRVERLVLRTVGALLLILGMAIHTVGATSRAALHWNLYPTEIDQHPERLWDWRHPPFLAPLQRSYSTVTRNVARTASAEILVTSTAPAAQSFAMPIIGCISGCRWSISASSAALNSSAHSTIPMTIANAAHHTAAGR